MEEREALEVQKRLAAEMRDDDFGLDIFQVSVRVNSTRKR